MSVGEEAAKSFEQIEYTGGSFKPSRQCTSRQTSTGSRAIDRPSFLVRNSSGERSAVTSFAFANVVLDQEEPIDEHEFAKQPLTTEFAATINLTKNLIGSGIFSTPLALSKSSVILGLCMMAFVCSLCGGSFILIARNCRALGCSTYREMGMKSMGPRLAYAIEICLMVNGILSPLAYIILVCDFFSESIPELIGWNLPRWQLIACNTLAFVLPLSYIKDLSPLRIPSIVSLLIIAYIFVYVVVYWVTDFEKGIPNLKGGALHLDMGVFFATSVFTGAFSAHYNSPTFYRELGEDLSSHARVVRMSFISSFFIYAFFALAGYAMWGDSAKGNILQNYGQDGSGGKTLAVMLFMMAFSVTLSFPLVFNSGRLAFYGVFPVFERLRLAYPSSTHFAVTTGLVVFISFLACFVKDVQIVVGLTGALLGQALCFIIPAVVYLQTSRKPATLPLKGEAPLPKKSTMLLLFSILILFWGCCSQICGSLVVLGILG